MELSVIIPTRNRCAILSETLDRLESQCGDAELEVVVVDDGSTDDTADVVRRRAAGSPFPLSLIEQARRGQGAARNRALAAVRAHVCLFIDDDTWPCAGLVARHAAFHRQHPGPRDALLGHVDIAARPVPTPFMRWWTHQHLGYAEIDNPDDAGGHNFFSGNVSAKTDFIRDAGGFDEEFGSESHEDIDLGLRLQQHGMRLTYDRHAVVEHYQPVDLSMAVDRSRTLGRTNARFVERHPGRPVPRRPGARHRIKASTLTGLTAIGLRSPRLQREIWRFLCHEAFREAFWREVDSRDEQRDPPPPERLRIGRRLARLATRDEDARLPPS